MKNRIYYVKGGELAGLKTQLASAGNIWVAEMDGSCINNREDYFRSINTILCFPTPVNRLFDAYLDWMRDLDWLNAEGYLLIITNFSEFLKNDPALKAEIIDDFSKIIFPWWEEEVERCSVGGKAKPFNVILVD
jgi:hypothetical protein